ncbi:5'-AMP-activated protein kinase subunit gamma-2 [Balamuthia mandrillaris]
MMRKNSNASSRLRELLQGTTIQSILPERSIISISAQSTTEEALELLSRHRILSMPVWDSEHMDYKGMIDVMDILVHSVLTFKTNKDHHHDKERAEWKFCSKPVGSVLNLSTVDVFLPMEEELSLFHAMELFTRGIHRLPVVRAASESSHNEDHAHRSLIVVNVLSQSSIVRFLWKHKQEALASAGENTLLELKLAGNRNNDHSINSHNDSLPLSVRKGESTALEAFELMAKNLVEAVPIVDDEGKLCGELSAGDLRGLNPASSNMYDTLQLPVMDFVEAHHVQQEELCCCTQQTKLKHIISKLTKTRAHRVWVIGDENRVTGVVTLSDIMRALFLVMNPHKHPPLHTSSSK